MTPFYGELLRRRIAGPFVITESAFRGGCALPTHAHDLPYFTFTLKGSYRERYGIHGRLCARGTGVAHPAAESHSQIFDREPAVLIRIAPADAAIERLADIAVEQPAAQRNALLASALCQLHRELERGDDYGDPILEDLAYELTRHALDASSPHGGSRKRAFRAQLLMRSSLRYTPSIAEMASEMGVSRATLYRDFRSTFRRTPAEYLRETRIAAAANALRKNRRPVAEIAAECGFYDQSHFDRCFRLAMGTSPTEYRRSLRR